MFLLMGWSLLQVGTEAWLCWEPGHICLWESLCIPAWGAWPLALAWPRPGCGGILRNELQNEGPSLSFPLPLYIILPFKQTNSKINK